MEVYLLPAGYKGGHFSILYHHTRLTCKTYPHEKPPFYTRFKEALKLEKNVIVSFLVICLAAISCFLCGLKIKIKCWYLFSI